MASERFHRSVGLATNVLTMVVLAAVIVMPGSPLRSAIDERLEQRSVRRSIEESWGVIVDADSRVGDSTDTAILVEFVDYQCPICRDQHEILERHLVSHGSGQIVFRHFPLSIHPAAPGAARAAICAEVQGYFAEMHNYLYSTEDWLTGVDFDWRAAPEAVNGMDVDEFMGCLRAESTQHRLDFDMALARQLGIFATPSFVGRGTVHIGLMVDSVIHQYVMMPKP